MRKIKVFLSYSIIAIIIISGYISIKLTLNRRVINTEKTLDHSNLIIKESKVKDDSSFQLNEDIIDFENFDYKNGVDKAIIPNIVHYLFLNDPNIRFYHFINILTAYFNHQPDFIYFHCDNCSFSGKYLDSLRNFKELWSIIKFYKIPFHKTVFGVNYG